MGAGCVLHEVLATAEEAVDDLKIRKQSVLCEVRGEAKGVTF
jgi:hypothetical protein